MRPVLHDLVCMGCGTTYRAVSRWSACDTCGAAPARERNRISGEYPDRGNGRGENQHYDIATITTE